MSPWHCRSSSPWSVASPNCLRIRRLSSFEKDVEDTRAPPPAQRAPPYSPRPALVGGPGVPGLGGAPPPSLALVRVASHADHRPRLAAQDRAQALDVRAPTRQTGARPGDRRAHLSAGPGRTRAGVTCASWAKLKKLGVSVSATTVRGCSAAPPSRPGAQGRGRGQVGGIPTARPGDQHAGDRFLPHRHRAAANASTACS